MRRLFVFAAAMAALGTAVLWAEPIGLSETPPVGVPDWLSEPAIPVCPPPHWIPKQPGHYSLTDWRRVIDSTWGPGLPTAEKLAIFDSFWSKIDDSFPCFNNLTVNWDSLRTVYRAEVEDSVSRGRFAAIMNHLSMALREGHTGVLDLPVNTTARSPGVPLWAVTAWLDVGHFGAGLTPLPDSSLLVYQVVPGHPLGLEPGDIVLGYDRRAWTDILRELRAAQLPVYRPWGWGSCSTAMTNSLLSTAGMNWHLFDTIDIAKYATGDTAHLPTSLMVGDTMHLIASDQLDIPGVPKPDPSSSPSVTYGIVSGTRVGYIYAWRWTDDADVEFQGAVNALVGDSTLQGIIFDLRYNEGGYACYDNLGQYLLFKDTTATVCYSARSDPDNHYSMTVVVPPSSHAIPGNGIGYDRPIAVLIGPRAFSAGDLVALRMTFHPRVRTFGRSTSGAFNFITSLTMPSGWIATRALYEACLASDRTYFLTHREFPVDVPVWHTRDAVARGEDNVVTTAMAWIDSVASATEELETPAANRPSLTATVIRGSLNLQSETSSPQSEIALLDISGRKVRDLKQGTNDVGMLAPGVYFVRTEPSVTHRVVVTR